jgi:hypothetical protein
MLQKMLFKQKREKAQIAQRVLLVLKFFKKLSPFMEFNIDTTKINFINPIFSRILKAWK